MSGAQLSEAQMSGSTVGKLNCRQAQLSGAQMLVYRCFFIIVVVDVVVLSFGVSDDVVHVVDVLEVVDCPSGAPIVNELRHKISCF
jgi:hypothetical protein